MPCNLIIGIAADDPDRLRRIADNLEIMLSDLAARLAEKPEQATLDAFDNRAAQAAVEALPVPQRLRAVAEG